MVFMKHRLVFTSRGQEAGLQLCAKLSSKVRESKQEVSGHQIAQLPDCTVALCLAYLEAILKVLLK